MLHVSTMTSVIKMGPMNKKNKYLKKLYMTVKRNIDKVDCYHLLEDGAPPDEFDIETKDICRRIRPENTAEEIAKIIVNVYEEWLDVNYQPSDFMDIANEIERLRKILIDD